MCSLAGKRECKRLDVHNQDLKQNERASKSGWTLCFALQGSQCVDVLSSPARPCCTKLAAIPERPWQHFWPYPLLQVMFICCYARVHCTGLYEAFNL